MSDTSKNGKWVTITNFISRKAPCQAEHFLSPDSETKSSNHSMKMTLLASNFLESYKFKGHRDFASLKETKAWATKLIMCEK